MKDNRVLDIIMTHYDEPFGVGKPFFDMLAMQRMVNLADIRVLIVQDGKDTNLEWKDLAGKYPFDIEVAVMDEHRGLSAARNVGIQKSTAEWITFVDFDDTFSSIYSLYLIMNVMPTNGEDCLYADVFKEMMRGGPFINIQSEDFTCANGKIYRRQALIDKNLRFNESFTFRNDIIFNETLYMTTPAFRIKKLESQYALFVKTLREGSIGFNKESIPRRLDEMLVENIVLALEAQKRKIPGHNAKFAVRAMFDAYYILGMSEQFVSDAAHEIATDFIRDNITFLDKMRSSAVEVEMSNASNKMEAFVQYVYNHYQIGLIPPEESMDMAMRWIHETANAPCPVTADEQPAPQPEKPVTPAPSARSGDERIVVYCGTENTYECMVISAKTLLSMTHVDKVYFLTEHDKFPMEIPSIIQNINVKNQTWFTESCPNHNNPWTYMCLMRAAFTKLFPQHSKILSLDIDVAVNDDISSIWDYDISDYYLAGVPELNRPQKDYINFGIVVMNLDKLRADHKDDEIITALNTSHYDCPEQSAFSELCKDKILLLPSDYNYAPNMTLTEEPENELITHYAGIKYWRHLGKFRKMAEIPWKDILKDYPPVNAGTKRVAVYAGTRNLYNMMELSAKSLLAHTSVDEIIFLIEDDKFPRQLPPCIRTMNVREQHYFTPDGPNYNSMWTYMVLMRAALPLLLPDYDTVLSIDCDTLVREDVSAIWDTDLSNAYFAACIESRNAPTRALYPYYNCGVILMNLDKLRKDGMAQKVIDSINTTFYQWNEQDALNEFCQDHIATLPSRYNAFHCTDVPDRVAIRHYVGNEIVKNRFYTDAKNAGLKLYREDIPQANLQRWDILNNFITARGYRSFLEIGTDKGETFDKVNAPLKTSVDPNPVSPATFIATSDEFFKVNNDKFDIIFIDGLHEHNQVWRDILNSLNHLNKNGVIVLHDCNPQNEREQTYSATPITAFSWQGTAWKAFVKARATLPYEMCVLTSPNSDSSCGIIDTSRLTGNVPSGMPSDIENLTFHDLSANRQYWLNLRKEYDYE